MPHCWAAVLLALAACPAPDEDPPDTGAVFCSRYDACDQENDLTADQCVFVIENCLKPYTNAQVTAWERDVYGCLDCATCEEFILCAFPPVIQLLQECQEYY